MISLGVLISGSGTNLQAIIDACREGRLEAQVRAVISDKEEARGLERARKAGIEAIFLNPAEYESKSAYNQALAETLKERQVDLVCLAGYMRIVRRPMFEAFGGSMLNIHPSLLPAFPGLDAQRQALEHGVKVTGCTVHFVTPGMDEGPIIMQASVPVLENDTVETLRDRILVEEHRIYPAAIQLYAQGKLRVEGRRVVVAQ